jgi:hypothetical protein
MNASLHHAQERSARSDLDIVRVGTQAKDRQPISGIYELE